MGWVTSLAVFFVIWWTVLFAVLPIGMRSQADDNEIVPGTPHSAPSSFSFGRAAAMTTGVSLIVFVLFYLGTEVFGLGPGSFPHFIPGT